MNRSLRMLILGAMSLLTVVTTVIVTDAIGKWQGLACGTLLCILIVAFAHYGEVTDKTPIDTRSPMEKSMDELLGLTERLSELDADMGKDRLKQIKPLYIIMNPQQQIRFNKLAAKLA